MDKGSAFILWFDQLNIGDIGLVGGKNASLGEMYSSLTQRGVRVPNGFAITAAAYRYLLDKARLREKIEHILGGLDTGNIHNLQERGHKIRDLIRSAEFPPELRDVIFEAYSNLCNAYKKHHVDVAVRSSATAEDLPDASFAGQQETYLNIRGESALIEACKKCFASLFTNRAISYRQDKGFDHFSIALSIGVQKMVRSDKACSGVMFSIDTETGFREAVLINAAYGLGENIVQGAVNPDEFYVFKPTLKQGFKPIIQKRLGEKNIKMVYDMQGSKPTKNIHVSNEDRERYCLTDDEVIELANYACIIEDHYSQKAGHFKPMDMEWAKDGESGQLFIVQARPETVQSQRNRNIYERFVLKEKGAVLVAGKSVGERIGAGRANVIRDVHRIDRFKKGEVLVTDMTDPDWEPIMKIASAIVTNRGGRTCHAAIISRELGIPCVVGTNTGTQDIRSGADVTVSCAEGETGNVYKGMLKFDIEKHDITSMPKPRTRIMMNLAAPGQAFEQSFIPNDGVGLARMEFVVNEIGIHPKALLYFDRLKDSAAKREIARRTKGYKDKAAYFVEKLSDGIGMIAAAFYPKPVILRMSDFKTNEYANLVGGHEFEPKEDNPMLGWRGASRYYTDYKDGFALECSAVKRIREGFGLKNLEVMIPFCRTVQEGRKVLEVMAKNGLRRGEDGLKVICMCEIPSNVLVAEQFLDIFDGFSIGTNDLTQLTLGVDRDSSLVAEVYDERNDAVKVLVRQVIEVANKRGKYIGICGQAPSDYPEFAEFVVRCGIHSMSLNPDTVIKTTLKIAKLEQSLGK